MSPQPNRRKSGGLIDRGRTLSFTFDGKSYSGHPGDTLSSALLANGVRLVGRSFKYHRPRGIVTAGVEEPSALVELRSGARREPNTRATTTELYERLEASSQNRWPSLKFDVLSVNSLLSPFLVGGFYYKTFMWPASFWEKVYEPAIRRAAGLGRAAGAEDPDHYEKAFAHCDVLVIGSGPAGLMAALAAGRAGARVILAEQDFRLGGNLLAERLEVSGLPAWQWASDIETELASLPHVRIMRRTTVFGVYDAGTYGALERVSDHLPTPPEHLPRQRMWRIYARRAVLAAGAIERPVVFGDNDRPGVMLGSAVRSYVNRYGALPGRRAVVFTTGDDGWRTAVDLASADVKVEAIVDSRSSASGAGGAVGTTVYLGGRVMRANGAHSIHSVDVLEASGRRRTVPCDLLAVSNGWDPCVHLTCHQNGKPVWDGRLHAFVPGTLPAGMSVAGAAAGRLTLSEALSDGVRLGGEAASSAGFRAVSLPLPKGLHEAGEEGTAVAPIWRIKQGGGKRFVDLQNDVTDKDVEIASREGYRSVEHLKRYTTLGMATDQGKTSGVAGLAILAEVTGRTVPEVGTTIFRPPYAPVAIGAMAGHHRGRDFRPIRLPPSHDWAKEQGAVFMETGPWLRAQWFPQPGEKDWFESVMREVTAIRSSVGICDVSTLGKIDIVGADAGEFLDRVYTNTFSTLAVGRARYGLMLREDGFVMDDGTTSRLGPDHFLMTTTTANAGKTMQHLEFCHQVLWPSLDVCMVSVSEQWAQFSVAGPRSRDLLRKVIDRQHDISDGAFPYMAAGEMTIGGGIPARLFRISFSGELAYEIATPARFGDGMVRALMDAGREWGVTPYGIEALNVMRIEKGHVAGPELNGTTTARDLGLAKMVSSKKDCIGKVMSQRPALLEPDRPIFIGIKPVDRTARLRSGAHFIPAGAEAKAENDEGYVTSVAHSPMLGHYVGLGLLRRGRERIGERVRAVDPVRDGDVECEICDPVFFDPEGERLRG